MVKFKKETSFFDGNQKQKPCAHKKMSKLLKSVGGRKGLMLASLLMQEPKFKEF